MLSEHEMTVAVREMFPDIQALEAKCRALFNQRFIKGIGPTGCGGSDELDFSIGHLLAAAGMLKRLRSEFRQQEQPASVTGLRLDQRDDAK